jgi:hypothetical protein
MTHDRNLLNIGAWSGFAYIGLFGLGWLVLDHFVPPIAPSDSAAEVAARYADNHVAFMIGAVAMMVSSVMMLPLGALLVLLLQKIEGGVGMLSLMMGFTAVTTLVLTFYTGLAFDAAAFRSDRPDAIVQVLNDLGFLGFMGGTPMFLAMFGLLAYAILITQPRVGVEVFPRWVGYVNLLIVICYLPEVLVFIFHTGPFAWNGFVGFWIPAVLLIGCAVASPVVLRPVVRRAFP